MRSGRFVAVCAIAVVGMVLAISAPAYAAISYDQNVTPDVIFGSGNSNGGFTVDRGPSVELGLRAKIPYTGVLHSNGDGTYSYSLVEADPKWNFDWTVNTDYLGTSGVKIANLTYRLGIDFDPSQGTDFLEFDPINLPYADHSIGTNATPNGGGAEAGDPGEYANLIANNNVLQQSWRHAFFTHPTLGYDPSIDGTYDIFLTALNGGDVLASTSIQVVIGEGGAPLSDAAVPEPASLIIWSLLGVGCVGAAVVRRRRRRA